MNSLAKSLSKLLTLTFLFFLISCQTEQNSQSDHQDSYHQPKLFLLSKGLVNDTLKAEFLQFLDADPHELSVAVIVNATSSRKKMVKKTKKVQKRFAGIGFDSTKIDLFDILDREVSDLYDFDIIYTLGGNPFDLLSEIRQSGADSVLIDIAGQGKILMGYSAGSMLLGPNLDMYHSMDSLLGFNQMGLSELECLNLYDFLIFPHYKDFTGQVPELIGLIDDFETTSGYEVVRLSDDQGLIIENGEKRIIGY